MNINHKQKTFDKLLKKSAKAVLTVFLAIFAVVAGIQAGNLWYKLDFHIIKSIDPNNFKNLISISIPIVESVYNSGKSSVSFSGEVKELFVKVFDFDLDSPASILNAQSPIFKSYYNIMSLKKISTANNELSGNNIAPGSSNIGDSSSVGGAGSGSNGGNVGNGGDGAGNGTGSGGTGNESSNGNGSDSSGNGNSEESAGGKSTGDGTGTGNSSSGTGSGDNAIGNTNVTGNGTGSGNGGTGNNGTNKDPSGDNLFAGQLDGTPESSMSIGTEYGYSNNTGITGQTNNSTGSINSGTGGSNQGSQQQSGGTGGNSQIAQGVQPISSVAFEVEDEKDGDEKETVELDKIQIKNFTKHKIDIAKLLKEPLNINLSKKGPKVLIYHTHTTESYVLKEADLGMKDVPSFNSNPKYNVVRVGEELTRNLEKYGIETLHNGTVHDKVHDAAYGVSINTIQSYKKSYPSIQVYIDIHRDAVGSDQPKLRMTKEINGKNCAQIMFVVGADGMLPHPQWKENLKFVLKLQQKLNEKYPGLAKPVRIVAKRYNQQISNNAILIEVGGDGNLLSECVESTKYLAEVLNDVMKGK